MLDSAVETYKIHLEMKIVGSKSQILDRPIQKIKLEK